MTQADFSEIGTTGLSQFSGIIQADFLREWRGKEAYKRSDEMRRNSPVIAALLQANELSIRKVSWTFTSDIEGDPRVELLDEARENMRQSWNDFVVEILTMLPFGFSLFEPVLERVGPQVLWRKFAPRGQDTVYRWEFNTPDSRYFDPRKDNNELLGFTQQTLPSFAFVYIPVEKLLLFRTKVERDNPEGASILRPAWVPYYYAKHIQQIEAIGIERDLAGLPVIKLPQGADTTDNDTSDFGVAAKMVRNIRNDEQGGAVVPFGWDLSLLSTGGSRQFDTDKIVRRYESRMLMSALAQFIMLGQDSVGSLALSQDSTDFFVMAVNSIADIISETFTHTAIPRLLKLNGYDAEGVCLEHTPAGDVDSTAIADFLQKVGGMITWDAQDELWLRQLIGLPERDVLELQSSRDQATAQQQAAADAIRARLTGNPPSNDGQNPPSDMPMDNQPDNQEGYSAEHFAADPADVRKRRQMERQLQALVEKKMAETKRKVMKYAKEVKAT
jgi:hypothetical protein